MLNDLAKNSEKSHNNDIVVRIPRLGHVAAFEHAQEIIAFNEFYDSCEVFASCTSGSSLYVFSHPLSPLFPRRLSMCLLRVCCALVIRFLH